MHQPYYRSARSGTFGMPWARLHALKDYLDMVDILSDYPALRQTFNLVPSLVEQLQDYASGEFSDVYWEHTLKPAAELDQNERAFVVERMCEHPDHPRAKAHPRYLELARKRAARTSPDWQACAASFTVDELRDLQVWSVLAWFDAAMLEADPLAQLVQKGRDFREEDKLVIAAVQAGLLSRTLPAYRDAARRGQIELSTSPYFHPILPLLCNSDSARVAAPDVILPRRRFAHPEDAAEHVAAALLAHERVFGERPRGMWCSEQAVGEDVLPLLTAAGLGWTISDETVLARSLAGARPRTTVGSPPPLLGAPVAGPGFGSAYHPYLLERETGTISIVFRDHTLSDLVGFAYQSWDSREAAADLLRRLGELRTTLLPADGAPTSGTGTGRPLVTIALDGENAWEYYPRDGRDFLRYLYEGLTEDPAIRCVTVSEHLRESPAVLRLDWLHTGSWIGGDLLTWTGDSAHGAAWDALHDARDLVAARRRKTGDGLAEPDAVRVAANDHVETAWRHILVAEGSDWFWWFGDHHHTELDAVWDLEFRLHLQEAYRLLGESVPTALYLPFVEAAGVPAGSSPLAPIDPIIDGLVTDPGEWDAAGRLAPDLPSTMQRSAVTKIREVRFGWQGNRLCLLVIPGSVGPLEGLELELRVTWSGAEDGPVVHMSLADEGKVVVRSDGHPELAEATMALWRDVLEVSLPLDLSNAPETARLGLVLRAGRDGMTEHVFHSVGLASLGWRGQ
jgi:alpha-amylase/alpha-mannosidase (GH57 family)